MDSCLSSVEFRVVITVSLLVQDFNPRQAIGIGGNIGTTLHSFMLVLIRKFCSLYSLSGCLLYRNRLINIGESFFECRWYLLCLNLMSDYGTS